MNLDEDVISGERDGYIRKVWVLPPPDGNATRLAVLLDGEFYVHHMRLPEALYSLQRSNALRPFVSVFVSHVDAASRHADLPCNRDYARFIARDVVGWAKAKHPELQSHGNLVGGPSLGGLAAAFTALCFPETFSRCLAQSGSFWWQKEWLTANLDTFPAAHGKFWISVGDRETGSGISHPPSGMRQEVSQIAACERFAAMGRARGHNVQYSVYEGGHDFAPWKAELPEAIGWLFSDDAPEPSRRKRTE